MKNVLLFFVLAFYIPGTHAQQFSDQSTEIGIDHAYQARSLMGGGAAFFDYENDGDDDLYLTGGQSSDNLYKNNGDGTFTKINANSIGLDLTHQYNTTGIASGDIDNDGDRELFITTWERNENGNQPIARSLLFLNNGDGSFSEIGEAAGITHAAFGMGACFLDYNKDGFLDVYVINHVEAPAFTYDSTGAIDGFAHECYPNFLYKNNGDNTFTEVATSLGLDSGACTLAAMPSDYDLDGDLDIFTANDFGPFLTPNELFQNNYPDDHFEAVGASTGANISMYGMGIAAGDYDHDQDLDYYISNLGQNVLLENTSGNFEDVAAFAGVENTFANGSDYATGWGTAFFDVNNDSWEDLFVANGRIPSLPQLPTAFNDPNKLFLNNGDKTFTDITEDAGVGDEAYNRGMAYSDYDNDGDLDMIVVALNELGGQSSFYVNETENDHHYVQFKLRGTISNRDAYGSKIWLFAGGQTFLKELYGGGASHLSQHTSILHFGLGSIDEVDSIRVEWTNGQVDHLGPFEADRLHLIEEGAIGTTSNETLFENDLDIDISPNPFVDQIRLSVNQYISGPVHVRLIAPTGSSIFSKKMYLEDDAFLTIDPALPLGLYLLSIESEQGRTIKKLVKSL